ncbi:MAG: Endonuclease [Phycisphaerales bacterium]|nr:Endonuclease [Phycisphaerales bacterium]
MASRVAEKKLKVRRMLVLLTRMYGRRTWTSRGPGLDVLVEAMLAQNTNMANARRGYAMLRRRFSSWTKVMNAQVADVQREITICGLARMRAHRLQDLLRTVKRQRGRLSLDFLADEPPADATAYLTAFHGIGPKTAAVTLLFAFDAAVLPVDNGILRVARRLRLVRPKARDAEAERVLSPLVAEGRHYATHTLMFRHAKERCRPRNPKCHECALLEMCPWGRRVVKHKPPEREGDVESGRRGRRPILLLAKHASAGIAKRAEAE